MKYQIFNTKCNTTERIFVLTLTISLVILTYKVFAYSTLSITNILIYIFLVSLFCILAFLSYFDFKKMEVHNTLSFVLMITLVLINIVLFFTLGSKEEITVLNNWLYNPYNNIIATLILGLIFQLIVLISKEKALGQGDVRIAIISGLLIGLNSLIPWAYITVFTALIYGTIVGYKKKKFKNLRIPLVPFMFLGVIIVILMSI